LYFSINFLLKIKTTYKSPFSPQSMRLPRIDIPPIRVTSIRLHIAAYIIKVIVWGSKQWSLRDHIPVLPQLLPDLVEYTPCCRVVTVDLTWFNYLAYCAFLPWWTVGIWLALEECCWFLHSCSKFALFGCGCLGVIQLFSSIEIGFNWPNDISPVEFSILYQV
jgi:hypothetical protein